MSTANNTIKLKKNQYKHLTKQDKDMNKTKENY